MNILSKKDEILAALGNIRAMERLHVDTHTEKKIKNISGIKIAESKQGQIWVSFQELNGFLFMNSTILSHLNLKTIRGTKITILTNDYEIEIDSDEKEIESDFSNVSNTWITKVSFVLDAKEKEIIENRNFEEIEYQLKKGKLKFLMKK
ncbi:hypothetical protein [Kordia sp.]|uniref:hypothetical protein n=1 Tax=Kordia sp. TaxID=1965332 RepID=UPI003D6AB3B5